MTKNKNPDIEKHKTGENISTKDNINNNKEGSQNLIDNLQKNNTDVYESSDNNDSQKLGYEGNSINNDNNVNDDNEHILKK